MIYPKLGVKIGAGKTPGIYHPVVGVLISKERGIISTEIGKASVDKMNSQDK